MCSTNERFDLVRSLLTVCCGNCMVVLIMQPALQCVQQRTGESSGLGSDGDCGCPTGRSALSKSPPPPGWDEIGQNPQIQQETEERGRGGKGCERRIVTHISLLCSYFTEKIHLVRNQEQR